MILPHASECTPTGTNLTERVYRCLAAEIVEGRLAPGQQLLETALAKELGVSRTPVREALRLLVNEGLAMATPGGVIVTQLTVKDVRDRLTWRPSANTSS